MITRNEDRKLPHRRLTDLERSKVALTFIKMQDSPDRFMLENRYCERKMEMPAADRRTSISVTPLQKKQEKLVGYLKKLEDGGHLPEQL